jgi:catechol 2,3-dioxygenase-like lactoylglutathione lyase family enzyme
VLGFRLVTIEQIDVKEGGCIRHAFFDCGDGQLLGFMEPRGIEGLPAEYDTGINRGLGLPDMFYHVAFNAGSVQELHAKRSELIAKGVRVTPIVDHEWVLSIYFKDPNGLLLEYAAQTRAPAYPHVSAGRRFTASIRGPSRVTDFRDSSSARSHVNRRLAAKRDSENVSGGPHNPRLQQTALRAAAKPGR